MLDSHFSRLAIAKRVWVRNLISAAEVAWYSSRTRPAKLEQSSSRADLERKMNGNIENIHTHKRTHLSIINSLTLFVLHISGIFWSCVWHFYYQY